MKRDKLVEKMLKDMGDRNNTIDLDAYARGLIDMYEQLKNCNLQNVMAMLPNKKEAEQYANGNFGFEADAYDKELAFISGADWMRCEVEQKLNGN